MRFSWGGLALLTLLLCPFVRAGNEDDRSLSARVQELERMLGRLQRRVEALEAGRGVRDEPARAAEAAAEVTAPAIGTPVPTTNITVPRPSDAAAPEGAIRLGPVKLNGEFRLFFDSILRHEGGGAPRVSTIRGRYLMHLDFDAALQKTLSVHGQLSTAPLNNPLTDIQDFGGGVAKHPFFLSLAYVDYHPNAFLRLQGGRVDNPFNDRSRFLFDSDTRFNGTNEMFRLPVERGLAGVTEIQVLAGQYTFTNPNFPVISPGTASTAATATPSQALLAAGAAAGTQPRSSQLFQQGVLLRGRAGEAITYETIADLQLYRNPNQLRLMSTAGGLFLVANAVGISPSGPVPSASNATTTPGGAELTAPGYRIGRISTTLAHRGVPLLDHAVPVSLNVQFARNIEAVSDRNAMAAILAVGRTREAGDLRLAYGYYRKEANSLIGELTENDIAIGGNVNMQAHVGRIEYALGRGVVFANDLIWTRWLKDSNPGARFFVPLGRSVPGQFRYQGMLIFRF